MTENKFHALIRQMITTNRMHKKAIETVVDDIGIHRGRHHLLMNIAKRKFNSQKEIADHLGITPAAVTGMLAKLESDGLIVRTVGRDGRFNEISITEKGKSIVENSRAYFDKVDERVFLGLSESELATFSDCLVVMQSNLEKIMQEDKK